MGNSGSPNVRRRNADEVFYATSTEPLRKHKSSDNLHDSQRRRIAKQASEIVEKGAARVARDGKKDKDK